MSIPRAPLPPRFHLVEEDKRSDLERLEGKVDSVIHDAREAFAKLRKLDDAGIVQDAQLLVLSGKIGDLEKLVGKPPKKLESRASHAGELTAQELSDLERGTGLAGVVGRLVAGQARLARKVAIGSALGAGIAAGGAPVLVDLIKQLFGG